MAEEDVEMVAALAVGGQSDIVPRVETPADLETLAKGELLILCTAWLFFGCFAARLS